MHTSSAESPFGQPCFMSQVREFVVGLGLGEYADAFISEGFDTLETLQDITESDLYVICPLLCEMHLALLSSPTPSKFS